MISIKCDQLFSYFTPEEYAVLEIMQCNGRTVMYLINGTNEVIYECDAVDSELNQSQLKMYLNSFSAIVVYDVNKLEETKITSAMLRNYQLSICDVGEQLAAFIGTWDIGAKGWLVRDLDEVLSFFRCHYGTSEPIERAKAILWLAEQLSESSSVELTTKREQKFRDYHNMQGFLLQSEGK